MPSAGHFNPDDYSVELTGAKIDEIRHHLQNELLPAARAQTQSLFLVPFVQYLDSRAERFKAFLGGPVDLIALVARNLLELSALMGQVFTNQSTRELFVGEMYVDAAEIRDRLERMGIPGKLLETEPTEWDAIPQKRVLLMKDLYDDYFFKLCSKAIHPSAISILAPDAMPGPLVFHVFGLHHLAKSYNLLATEVFPAQTSTND
jgi:hypothetical protein